MNKREIEKLLGLIDQNDQNLSDFSGFINPVEAKDSFDKLIFFRKNLSENEKDFSPFFTEKVMGRISLLSHSPRLEEYLSMLLIRVMTYGLTALVLVFFAIYILQRPDGFGSVLGTTNSNDINFISYLFYEF